MIPQSSSTQKLKLAFPLLFLQATDLSFLEKCHYNHALNELYSRPRMSSMEFGIKHFAGQGRINRNIEIRAIGPGNIWEFGTYR